MLRMLYVVLMAGAFAAGSGLGYFVGFGHGYDGQLLWMQNYNAALHRAWDDGFRRGGGQPVVDAVDDVAAEPFHSDPATD